MQNGENADIIATRGGQQHERIEFRDLHAQLGDRGALMIWHAATGRVTLFPTPQKVVLSAEELFREAFGCAPEAYSTNTTSNTSNAQGPHKDMAAVCSIQPARIDLGFIPRAPDSSGPSSQLLLIEDPAQLKAELGALVDNLSAVLPRIPCTRVAIFIQLTRVVADTTEGNAAIRGTLPEGFALPLTDEDNVIFQMNRQSPSRVSHQMRFNFITRWSLDNMKLLNVPVSRVGVGDAASLGAESLVVDLIASNIVFDNNTVPSELVLDADQVTEILHELLNRTPRDNGASSLEFT